MKDFIEQLRLAEKAAEDIYFARVDRRLIEALHSQRQSEQQSRQASGESGVEAGFEGTQSAISEIV
jgi:hypothetical protein